MSSKSFHSNFQIFMNYSKFYIFPRFTYLQLPKIILTIIIRLGIGDLDPPKRQLLQAPQFHYILHYYLHLLPRVLALGTQYCTVFLVRCQTPLNSKTQRPKNRQVGRYTMRYLEPSYLHMARSYHAIWKTRVPTYTYIHTYICMHVYKGSCNVYNIF